MSHFSRADSSHLPLCRCRWQAGVAVLLAVAVLAGCAGDRKLGRDPRATPEWLYEQAESSTKSANYTNAIFYLEQLESRFPFSDQAKQAQLDLMYVYYRDGQFESAIDAADNFIRENPTHPRVDYAYYIQGLSHYDPSKGVLEKLFRVDTSMRPPVGALDAYVSFSTLVDRFPNSQYAPDATQRIMFLRNRVARYEAHIAKYYIRRGAYVAALRRAHRIVENYYGSNSTYEALEIMLTCYRKLNMGDLAADTERLLEENSHLKNSRG
jgi:outer membrane protein assembly factor BamD